MKFEIFSGKFQNAVNILEMYGRGMHNEDIIYKMWIKVQSVELSIFVSSLKVYHRRNIQNYTNILQKISTQITTTKSQPLSNTGVSELNRIEARGGNRFGGDCPTSGAYMADGTLYTGSYP